MEILKAIEKDQSCFTDSVNCFLCNCDFQPSDETWLLFEKRFSESGTQISPLSNILFTILNISFNEESTHSKLVCDTCCNILLEYEACEKRLRGLKLEILNLYHNSLEIMTNSDITEDVIIIKQDEQSDYFVGSMICNEAIERNEENSSSEEVLFKNIEESFSDDNMLKKDDIDEKTKSQRSFNKTYVENRICEQINRNAEKSDNSRRCMLSQKEVKLNSNKGKKIEEIAIKEESSDIYIENAFKTEWDEVYKKMGENYICLSCKSDNKMDPYNFIEHMRTIHNHKFLTCDFCSDNFVRKRDLLVHLDIMHPAKENCEDQLCGQWDSNSSDHIEDLKQVQQPHKQYECEICSKKCNSKTLLAEHMNKHTGERPYKCCHCNKTFTSKYTLQSHLKTHVQRERPFHCDKCSKSFYNLQNLKQHSKLHETLKPVICEICSKQFSTQNNLNHHMIVHSNNKPYPCGICGKRFARKPEMKDHERIHSGERPFKCDLCPMAFAQRSNLTTHRKSTHFNEKQHQCDICSRSFKRRRLLEYHKQAVHTGERPHKCTICGASFVYPEHLKKHNLIHSGKKPYACELCGKSFSSRENRNAHRFVHSDKKPYECMKCGAGFMRKPLLLAHMKQTNHENDSIIINQPHFDNQRSGNIGAICENKNIVEDCNGIDVPHDYDSEIVFLNDVEIQSDTVKIVKDDFNSCVELYELRGATIENHVEITNWDDIISTNK